MADIDLLDVDPETGELFPPLILADMRYIYAGHTMAGEEPSRYKVLRKEFKENPKSFMDRLSSLEKDWLAHQRQSKKAEEKRDAGPDEGSVVALKLAEDLLRGWRDVDTGG